MRKTSSVRTVIPLATVLTLFAGCADSESQGNGSGTGGAAAQGLSCQSGATAPTEPTAALVVDPRSVEYAPELGVDFANMVATPEGLFCADLVVGDGDVAAPRSTARVHYTGSLADGTVFDDSRERDQPFPFIVGTASVIPGWDIGVMGMREGGRRILVVPSELAYGPSGAGDGVIPPNAVLVFDVELVEVN